MTRTLLVTGTGTIQAMLVVLTDSLSPQTTCGYGMQQSAFRAHIPTITSHHR